MKIQSLYNAICAMFIIAFLAGCNDYDAAFTEYEDITEDDEVIEAPDIDSDWELELVSNIGQWDDRVFVYKDKKYDGLFTRNLGWNGGDGVLTTLLPDGNVFWSFNDSFYGVVDEETRARGSCSFPRNSLMVQTTDSSGFPGDDEDNLVWLADFIQTDDPDADGYYQARTHIRHPDASLTDEEIEAGEIDSDYLYWAGDATVVDGVMQMTWGAVDENMTYLGSCYAEYSLEGEPGDDTYMTITYRDDDFRPADQIQFGSTLIEGNDGHIYLYGTESYNVYCARTTEYTLNCDWEYYICDLYGNFQWQSDYPTDEELTRSNILELSGACSMPWVTEVDGMYYLFGQTIYFGHTMQMWRSETPYGPFEDEVDLFTFPSTIDKLGDPYYYQLYMINLHEELSRDGELVFSTNTNSLSFWDNFNFPGSADYYRPYFFRVFGWQSVYEEEDDDE